MVSLIVPHLIFLFLIEHRCTIKIDYSPINKEVKKFIWLVQLLSNIQPYYWRRSKFKDEYVDVAKANYSWFLLAKPDNSGIYAWLHLFLIRNIYSSNSHYFGAWYAPRLIIKILFVLLNNHLNYQVNEKNICFKYEF